MAPDTYSEWLDDGSPWRPAKPVDDLRDTLVKHGYTVYIIGNRDHLTKAVPEDHTPFSHTAWPGVQPYPNVLAMDIMPGGAMDWRDLGARLVADKKANRPGTQWIKYINWTDRDGNCWHESWQGGYSKKPSSDTGHIHISGRTDYVNSDCASGYDPVTETAPHPAPAPSSSHLDEDGKLGPKTIKRWQQIMGTEVDGVISENSTLVAAVQRKLNSAIRAGLRVDGDGDSIRQNGTKTETIKALQRYLHTPIDGKMDSPVSMVVKALQHRLNSGKF